MSADLNTEPIACTLVGGEQVERRRRWEELCRRSLMQMIRTVDGVELHFSNTPVAEAELRSLVVLERDCCSFARWVLSQEGDQLVLQVSGAPGAEAAVQALFEGAPSLPA